MEINDVIFNPSNTSVLWNNLTMSISLAFTMKRLNKYTCVEIFKKTFGRQLKTWIGGSDCFRFWIWTFRINDTVLYAMVNNEKGIVWEYPKKTNTIKLMDIYIKVYEELTKNL